MLVTIRRQKDADSSPYWQSFEYELKGRETVAGILEKLNDRPCLTDIEGRPAAKIKWECSCLQKMCGACAMVVNREPVLACSKFIDGDKLEKITIEPLTKFPTICDLCVDRSLIFESLKEAGI